MFNDPFLSKMCVFHFLFSLIFFSGSKYDHQTWKYSSIFRNELSDMWGLDENRRCCKSPRSSCPIGWLFSLEGQRLGQNRLEVTFVTCARTKSKKLGWSNKEFIVSFWARKKMFGTFMLNIPRLLQTVFCFWISRQLEHVATQKQK